MKTNPNARRAGPLATAGISLCVSVSVAAAARVAVDVLPVEATNVVDPSSSRPVPVAILGSAELDATSIELESIRLAGSAIVKSDAGATHAIQDVNGDGFADLVVWFSAHELRVGDSDASAALEGRTTDGVAIDGRDVIRMLRASDRPAADAIVKEVFPAETSALRVVRSPDVEPGVLSQGRYVGGITIFDQAPASVYPATITVAGVSGVVSKLRVTLNGISHTCYNDLDVLLVGPSGQSLVLTSDNGGCGNAPTFTNVTFDDFAPAALSPATSALPQGSFRPANLGGGDLFPAPAPPAAGATRLSAFNGTNPNGTWSLYVVDDLGGDTGLIRDGWTLDIVTMTQVCSSASLTVPASGPASVYPSAITISGMPAQLAKVSVTLKGVTHTSPDDLDVMLVSPDGSRVMLMSDAGGTTPVSGLELTFDDDATLSVPDTGGIPWPGTYRPSDFEAADVLPAPAPAGAAPASFAPLRGYDPNGTWRLFVSDDTAGNAGSIAQGWCLNITSVAPSDSCQMQTIVVPGAGTSGPASPYPSVMSMTGHHGLAGSARIDLIGITHSFPDDLDIVLTTPSGRSIAVMSDVGGSEDVLDQDISFDSNLSEFAADDGPMAPGPYGFTDYVSIDPDALPAPGPQPPFSSWSFGEPPNGDWKLWVSDDTAADTGTIAGWCLSLRLFEPYMSTCVGGASPMTIPNGAPQNTTGPATPYPWILNFDTEGAIVRKVVVRLQQIAHTYPDDIDVLVVGPQGQSAVIMSDAGGELDIADQTITFDDEAPADLPDAGPLTEGTYRPTNYAPADGDFAAPAPPAPYGSQLSVFKGTNPTGQWRLYVSDDAFGDSGGISKFCIDVYPLYPSGEAMNVRWRAGGKNTLEWDAAANATEYVVYRGTRDQLPFLSSDAVDGCLALQEHRQFADVLATTPPPGTLFWYLVVGTSGGVTGPAGTVRVGGSEAARSVDPSGSCAAP